MRKILLRTGAILNFIFSAAHIACLFFLDKAFAFYGIDGMMSSYAELWAPIPYLITVFLVFCFALAGLYALSADGDIKKIPLTRLAVIVICVLFIGRALWGFAMMFGKDFSMLSLVTNLIALSVGICYLPGIMNKK